MEGLTSGRRGREQRGPGERTWLRRYGLALLVLAAMAIALPAQTFTTLVGFDGSDGTSPSGPLVLGPDGNFYGTTGTGGAPCALTNAGCGTVFKMTPGGALSTLHSFCAQPQTSCTDGYTPAGLSLGVDGLLYGSTSGAGANCSLSVTGSCGTLFRITLDGTFATLYSFCAQASCADGFTPNVIVQAADGAFYGTTTNGGLNNAGTVFRILPGGRLATLYNFCSQTNCTDGATPSGALMQAANGNLYGTTGAGGAADVGSGTIFEVTPLGKFTTLATIGGNPNSGVIQGTDGNFYGTAARAGMVFKVTPTGTVTWLVTVGGFPYYGLVQATDGNLYGTTYVGGANDNSYCQGNGCGSVFQVTPGGILTVLYNFCSLANCTDGYFPLGGLTQGTNGVLYGTTWCGGGDLSGPGCLGYAGGGYGSVFSLSVGLGAFVEMSPTSGRPGTVVRIFGTNLQGASGVSFDGSPARFAVVSKTEILTTVPARATTGTVQVATPGGTLSGNVPFRVQ